MRPATEWTEEDILRLVAERYEESIELEFKRSDALGDTDKKKNEISKDLSAFANSIGGTLIYGIQESNDKPRHAMALSPVDPTTISKEWLDQVINSRIHPRLSGVIIKPIELTKGHAGKVVYAVSVPQSTTAHQASDKKYYKRFNFEALAMEDYEVRQTMARASRPNYKISLQVQQVTGYDDCRFRGILENTSDIVAHDVSAVLFVPKWWVQGPLDAFTVKVNSIEYSRIPGTYVESSYLSKSFVDSFPPFVPHSLNFEARIRIPTDFFVRDGPILFTRIYDSFGLGSSAQFRFMGGEPNPALLKGETMPGRSQSPIVNGTLSDY